MAILSQDEAHAILSRAKSYSRRGELFLSLGGSVSALTRFADNGVTQNGVREDYELSVSVSIDLRSGQARTNRFDEASLRDAVRAAEENASLAPEDPEFMPLLPRQRYRTIDAYRESTAAFTAEDRVGRVERAIRECREARLVGAGTCASAAGMRAIASSTGLFGYHRWTSASFTLTVRTEDGSGSGKAAGEGYADVGAISFEALVEKAIRTAERSKNPVEIEPGSYTVVLEPAAAAEFVGLLGFSLDARAADEGRSFFSVQGDPERTNKLGEKLFAERLTLRSDPFHPSIPGSPFDGEGLPAEQVAWVEKGALRNLRYSRYWAKQRGKKPTPGVGSLVLEGGEKSLDQLVASVEDGLLVSTCWYIRSVDPMKMLYTGLTRDGVFRIVDGKVSHPVINFRWNESPARLFNNLIDLSRPEKVGGTLAPAILAKDFPFSSPSKAV